MSKEALYWGTANLPLDKDPCFSTAGLNGHTLIIRNNHSTRAIEADFLRIVIDGAKRYEYPLPVRLAPKETINCGCSSPGFAQVSLQYVRSKWAS